MTGATGMLLLTRNGSMLLLLIFARVPCLQGNLLSYNSSSQELHIRCPGDQIDGGSVIYVGLFRQHDDRLLANWSDFPNEKGKSLYDRLAIQKANPPQALEVKLRYATCFDVTNYTCNMLVTNLKDSYTVKRTQAFSLEGVVTDPVLRVQPPYQARFKAGDILRLTCSARIGPYNNSIVWETKLPVEEQFSPVIDSDCGKETNITEQKTPESETKPCGVTSVSSLSHLLTSDDENRQWRCRLRHTNQQAFFAVNVECLEGEECFNQSNVSALMYIFVAVIGVGMLIITIIFVSIINTQKLLRKKLSSSPGISPQSSEDSSYRTRSLPQLPPPEDHYATHDHQDPISRDEDQTPPKMFTPTTSSVYISMFPLPSLQESVKEREGEGKRGGEGLVRAGGVDAKGRRSESVYSNCEAYDAKVSDATASSRDSHVTMGNLKGWL